MNSAENLELIVFAETCSGAWFWIEYVVPIRIGWTIHWPPTDGAVIDYPDGHESVKTTLHVVMSEGATGSALCLSQPFQKHAAPKIIADILRVGSNPALRSYILTHRMP